MTNTKPSGLYFAIIIGAIVIVGASMWAGSFMGNYGQTPENISYLDRANEVSNQAEQMKDRIESFQPTGITPLDQFIASTYEMLTLLFSIGDIYVSFITDVGGVLMVPGEILALIIAFIFIMIIFGIIKIITKWDM
jgi:hypothetical protein